MRTVKLALVVALAFVASPVVAQTILGSKLDFKAKPGFPATRKLTMKSRETASPEVISGDPSVNGATVTVIVNGGTSSSQIMSLPPGARWRRLPSSPLLPLQGWRYKESTHLGVVTPVYGLEIRKSASGTLKLTATFVSKYQPLNVAIPNPGTYAGLVVTFDGGGGTYCTNFGGTAGGIYVRNDSVYFRMKAPTAEGTCASGTPVCGDGVVQDPFETCDSTNDAACPGLCGVNGLPCLCPVCGDGVIDPSEACDRPNNGACSEGCSYQCTCAVCGDGIVQSPVESCEEDLDCAEGPCGAAVACHCPECGDDHVNQSYEECDGSDDSACPGLCVPYTCTCPVCGNGDVEPGEECDTSSSPCGFGDCLPNCTCSVCGNNVLEGSEQCDGTDDAACMGACTPDCLCP
jgi:hypothetical protein